jgi:hypothetical protein
MPIATLTLLEPNKLPTTVGMVEKNPPLAAPLMITKRIRGPSEFDTGQMASILKALSNKERSRVLTGPMKSHSNPQQSRPTAEEKLNPATRPAPADGERPREAL